MTNPILEARQVRKSFGGVQALKGVDLPIFPGEVHALLGENGAGKSTLTKILCGIEQPDSGSLRWNGHERTISDPAVARALGVRTIHQELELASTLSVAENIFLGALPSTLGVVKKRDLLANSKSALEGLGVTLDPRSVVGNLRVGERQIIEIAKAMVGAARVLLMDEPTAALTPVEARQLLTRIEALKKQGLGIVYISHRLDEVLDVADRMTILRDGVKVAEFRRGEVSREEVIRHIVGRELANVTFSPTKSAELQAVACSRMTVAGVLEEVDFHVGRGEIVGFFGLLGAGQSAIAETMFGLRKATTNTFRACGLDGPPDTPIQAMAAGIGYVPADRKNDGLALGLSVQTNLLLTVLPKVTRAGFVRKKAARQFAEELSTRLRIRHGGIDRPVQTLSGGNQQKVVLGKWMAADVGLLLLDEPTRGVDVGAKAEIYKLLRRFAEGGGSVMVFSSDAEEIATACDRAYVLRRAKIAAELARTELSENSLIQVAL